MVDERMERVVVAWRGCVQGSAIDLGEENQLQTSSSWILFNLHHGPHRLPLSLTSSRDSLDADALSPFRRRAG